MREELNDRRFLLQYLWNEAIDHIAYIISNVPKYDIIWTQKQRCDWQLHFRDIKVQILDSCVQAHKILDREIHTLLAKVTYTKYDLKYTFITNIKYYKIFI